MRLAPLLILVVAAAMAAAAAPEPALGAEFTVNSTTDAVDANPGDGTCASAAGECTLRAAIQETNALPGADVVFINPASVTLAIAGGDEDASATGDLDVTDNLTLIAGFVCPADGRPCPGPVIDGGGIDRVLHIIAPATAEIPGLTIRNGVAPPSPPSGEANGGGVLIDDGAVLKLSNSVITENSAANGGGIYNAGLLSVQGGRIESNTGGGIANAIFITAQGTDTAMVSGGPSLQAHAVLDRVVVARNSGHGIANFGTDTVPGFASTMLVTNSTISGNSSSSVGGGIGNGGGMRLENVTLAENSAPNAAAIHSGGFGQGLSVVNSIITSSSGMNCDPNIFPLISLGHNLSNDDSCGLTQPGDIQNAEPLLGPLQQNGGDTLTHALTAGSPAIDSGDSAQCEAIDQRGWFRPRDGNGDGAAVCDIGAYELEAQPLATPTPSPTPRTLPDTGGTGDSRPAWPFAVMVAVLVSVVCAANATPRFWRPNAH
jgi:CSLREA domain-containing protein